MSDVPPCCCVFDVVSLFVSCLCLFVLCVVVVCVVQGATVLLLDTSFVNNVAQNGGAIYTA